MQNSAGTTWLVAGCSFGGLSARQRSARTLCGMIVRRAAVTRPRDQFRAGWIDRVFALLLPAAMCDPLSVSGRRLINASQFVLEKRKRKAGSQAAYVSAIRPELSRGQGNSHKRNATRPRHGNFRAGTGGSREPLKSLAINAGLSAE